MGWLIWPGWRSMTQALRALRRENHRNELLKGYAMATREIWHEILIKASPADIYEALTDVHKLAHWWTTDVRGESMLGRKLEFWFSGFLGAVMEVTTLRPNELANGASSMEEQALGSARRSDSKFSMIPGRLWCTSVTRSGSRTRVLSHTARWDERSFC